MIQMKTNDKRSGGGRSFGGGRSLGGGGRSLGGSSKRAQAGGWSSNTGSSRQRRSGSPALNRKNTQNRKHVLLPQTKHAELLPVRKGAARINRDHKNKNDRYKTVLRWFFYALTLMVFYGISAGGVFSTWQPIVILPLCAAVAMHEGELASGVFGMFCGFSMDMAAGKLFGFTALWLLPCAALIALLITHLIRVNIINHLWMTAGTCLIVGFMDYVFSYLLWDSAGAPIILTNFILPSYIAALVLAPPIFLIVKAIHTRFGTGAERDEITPENNLEQEE
jgi:cell shape-determining protein MreD